LLHKLNKMISRLKSLHFCDCDDKYAKRFNACTDKIDALKEENKQLRDTLDDHRGLYQEAMRKSGSHIAFSSVWKENNKIVEECNRLERENKALRQDAERWKPRIDAMIFSESIAEFKRRQAGVQDDK
jgi:FtsZ-binding cell division protein ZapB